MRNKHKVLTEIKTGTITSRKGSDQKPGRYARYRLLGDEVILYSNGNAVFYPLGRNSKLIPATQFTNIRRLQNDNGVYIEIDYVDKDSYRSDSYLFYQREDYTLLEKSIHDGIYIFLRKVLIYKNTGRIEETEKIPFYQKINLSADFVLSATDGKIINHSTKIDLYSNLLVLKLRTGQTMIPFSSIRLITALEDKDRVYHFIPNGQKSKELMNAVNNINYFLRITYESDKINNLYLGSRYYLQHLELFDSIDDAYLLYASDKIEKLI